MNATYYPFRVPLDDKSKQVFNGSLREFLEYITRYSVKGSADDTLQDIKKTYNEKGDASDRNSTKEQDARNFAIKSLEKLDETFLGGVN